MPDTPFESMTPDRMSNAERMRILFGEPKPGQRLRCERCGTLLAPGDWPFCKGKAGDHDR